MNNYYDPYAPQRFRMPQQTPSRHSSAAHISCDCCDKRESHPLPENTAVAMAYVPFQGAGEVYECKEALKRGTLFPVLDKPFTGCCRYE